MHVSLRSEAALARARCCAAFVIWSFLVAAGVLSVCSSSARILRTRQTPSERWDPWMPITIGSNIEFETDNEQSQYEFPMFLEYNFSQTLKLSLEPNVVHISPKVKDGRTVTGVGDLETSLEYEFLRERRYRPALTAEGLIRWPTASDPEIGDPGIDYSFGLIASKDLVFVDIDLRALYTFVSDRQEQDSFEVSLAAQWHLNRFLILKPRLPIPLAPVASRASPVPFREAALVEPVPTSPKGRWEWRGTSRNGSKLNKEPFLEATEHGKLSSLGSLVSRATKVAGNARRKHAGSYLVSLFPKKIIRALGEI